MPINRKILKWIFFCLIVLGIAFMLIGFASAESEICLEPIPVNTSCYMVTPSLICSADYWYEMYDNNGLLLENGTLQPFNIVATTYYFNFSEDVGTYYVKICDYSTRQVIVGGDTMIGLTAQTWIFIVLILLFVLFMILGFALHPIFLMLNGFIFGYFAFYTFTTFGNVFILIIMALVSIAFIFIGLLLPME